MTNTADLSDRRIRDVMRESGLAAGVETGHFTGGVVHLSRHVVPQSLSYTAAVPAGLHLSCGTGWLQSRSQALGGFDIRGAGLTALWCDEPSTAFQTDMRAGRSRAFGISLSADDLSGRLPVADIRKALKDKPLKATGCVPSDIILRLTAPIDDWFQGAARQLVLEARAVELIAVTLNWLSETQASAAPPRHADIAHLARDIIDAHLSHPPTLAELARDAGLSVRALTEAFRLTFGISIATYVTQRRLETALALLKQGMGVAQAAYSVGYAPAHFSNAFFRRYGFRPRDLRSEDAFAR